MKRFRLIWVLASLVCIPALSSYAQSQGDMRLNEYLIVNTTDFQDDFGQHNGWFELFNTSYGTVDIGGCYISNDPKNLKKYMKKRQHMDRVLHQNIFRFIHCHLNRSMRQTNRML